MRILHVVGSADPAAGGAIEAARQSGLALIDRGHQVDIVSADPPGLPWQSGYAPRLFPLGDKSSSYGYAPKVKAWLKENAVNYDVVIVNGIWEYPAYAAWQILHQIRKPYVVYTHGMLDPWFKRTYPLKHLKKWLYWPWATYRLLRDASRVLFTCEEEKLLARESFWLYKVKESVVPYCTTKPEADADAQVQQFYSAFPELKGKPFLLFLSRIHPKKGVDTLIDAFAKVPDSTEMVVVAGPDQVGWVAALKEQAAEKGIGNRLVWPGMLSGDLKWGAFNACDAFILPSHQENFGIVVPEALSCSKPVLISNKINIWREVEESKAGIVESDDLLGTINLYTKWKGLSSEARKEMSVRAKACFDERFEVSQAAGALLKVLTEVVGR